MRRAGFLVATAAALAMVLSGCSGSTTSGGAASSAPPSSSDLAVRVRYTGGLPGPAVWAPQSPLVSVYADGRVITEGPTPALAPGAALPNLRVQRISPAEVRRLADDGVAAGVAGSDDLGRPPLADALTTVFTVVTPSGRHVREVYALGTSGPGLTPEQADARAKLKHYLDELTTLGSSAGPDQPYRPAAVAVLARPWSGASGAAQSAVRWPGPDLPGRPVPNQPAETCVTAAGQAASRVLAAAGQATDVTPWRAADGRLWTLRFRPLLPDESGCADVTG